MRKFVFLLIIILCGFLSACGNENYISSKNNSSSVNETIETNDRKEDEDKKDNNAQNIDIEQIIIQTQNNIQPYLEVMGADITNGNPPVSQEFINNLNSVEIMGYIGSIEHGYNIYDTKTYIELLTWATNSNYEENQFYIFVDLMNSYFGEIAKLASYDYIDDDIYGWVEPSKQYSIITYFDNGKIYLQWDVRLDFEDEETLIEATESSQNNNNIVCIECGNNAVCTYENPFSGKTENYCYTHYMEILKTISMIEEDMGNSNYSKHTCEECNKEGTNVYYSFTGEVEYYCTTHYQELMELLNSMSLS